MINRVDERLEAWVSAALGKEKVPVGFAAPAAGKKGVSLLLLEVLPTPVLRTPKRPPLQLTLRYLVTVSAEDPAEAHRVLGDLAFAAMDNPDFDVEVEPLPSPVWLALGLPQRPGFVIRLPLRKERPEPAVRRVQLPLVLRNAPMRPWTGRVVGPGDFPIVAAHVESPQLGQSVETNLEGRFAFPGVPVGMPMKRLRIRAKGLVMDVDVTVAAKKNEPIVIRMDALEE